MLNLLRYGLFAGLLLTAAFTLNACAVYDPEPEPVAYAPTPYYYGPAAYQPAYYGPVPVSVGIGIGGGYRGGYHGGHRGFGGFHGHR